jgi:hypothetical protein
MASLAVAASHAADAPNPFPQSKKRADLVRRVCDRFVAETGFEGLSELEVYERVTAALAASGIDCKLRPTGDLVTSQMCLQAAEEKAELEVAKVLEMPDKEALEAEAAEKFPLLEKGDRAAIRYMVNPVRAIRVEGVYGGFDGRNIHMNRQHYPLETVKLVEPAADDPRDLIDPERNRELRTQYVYDKQLEFHKRKSEMLETRKRKHRRQEILNAIRRNEGNGYTMYGGNWLSLREVVQTEIGKRHEAWLAAKRKAEEEARRKAEEEAARRAAELEAMAPEGPEGEMEAPPMHPEEGLPHRPERPVRAPREGEGGFRPEFPVERPLRGPGRGERPPPGEGRPPVERPEETPRQPEEENIFRPMVPPEGR